MNILSIETSCERASIALLIDEEIVERTLEGHANHSDRLLATIRQLLADAGIGLNSLDAVAFGAGPGAFTGVRLACGVTQGLAMGADLGVAPICSLEALALQGIGESVLVATDARMGEVYSAAYRLHGGGASETVSPQCTPPESLTLPDNGQWFGLGSALRVYADRIPQTLLDRLAGTDGEAVPRARDVARLAEPFARQGKLLAPECAAPLYVRDKVALTTAERLARGGRA